MQMFILAADVLKGDKHYNCLAKINVFFGVTEAARQVLGFPPGLVTTLYCQFILVKKIYF